MDALKELLLHKLTLRLAYVGASILASHVAGFLVAGNVQAYLGNIFVDPTLKPGAGKFLEASLSSVLIIVGTVFFHFFHEKVVLPNVQKPTEEKTPQP